MIKQILTTLLERLWGNYCDRVQHASRYRELVQQKGGRIVHDHLAFRTLNTRAGRLPSGIEALARLITPLGYHAEASYEFPGEHLTARHYEHDDQLLPQIFVSQLEVDRLPEDAIRVINAAIADAHNLLDTDTQAMLRYPSLMLEESCQGLVDRLYRYLTELPWSPPLRDSVITVNKVSPYAAWTLLHGLNADHFAASVNEQQVPDWPDIEATVAALRDAGVPFKTSIEGDPELRQATTETVNEESTIREPDGRLGKLTWPYAAYQLAQRGDVTAPNGKTRRFRAFPGAHPTGFVKWANAHQ